MDFPEFLTYCKLKNIIVAHERMGHEWHAKVCNKQKLVIENDNFYATIIYTHFASEYSILHTDLSRVYTHKDIELDDASLDTIISRFA